MGFTLFDIMLIVRDMLGYVWVCGPRHRDFLVPFLGTLRW